MVPRNLVEFLHHVPRELAYFGSTEVSYPGFDTMVRSRCDEFGTCAALGKRGKHLREQHTRHLWESPQPRYSYAQGGAEGLSFDALAAVVKSDCIQRVGGLRCRDDLCLHRAEDATLGVCMVALGVPLLRCPCFFAWGPCDCKNATSCLGRLCHRPITIHKLKRLEWFDMWWRLLTQ